jgi:hypothetical protein
MQGKAPIRRLSLFRSYVTPERLPSRFAPLRGKKPDRLVARFRSYVIPERLASIDAAEGDGIE